MDEGVLREIETILTGYAAETERIESERLEQLRNAKTYEEEYEINSKYHDMLVNLDEQTMKKLEKILDEVVFVYIDSYEISSGIGFRHTRHLLKIGVKHTEHPLYVDVVFAYFTESLVYGSYRFKLDKVWCERQVTVTEDKTPFTFAFINNIPWEYIRPEWQYNIENMVKTLAEGEYEGRLREAINNVKQRLKAGEWIYDYMHVARALDETIQQMHVY